MDVLDESIAIFSVGRILSDFTHHRSADDAAPARHQVRIVEDDRNRPEKKVLWIDLDKVQESVDLSLGDLIAQDLVLDGFHFSPEPLVFRYHAIVFALVTD